MAVIFIVGAQQISVLHGTYLAVYGRWVVVAFLLWRAIVFLFDRRRIVFVQSPLPAMLFLMVLWELLVHLRRGFMAPEGSLFDVVDPLIIVALATAGIAAVAKHHTQEQALVELNLSYVVLCAVFVTLSLALSGGFFRAASTVYNERFNGIFRNPNYLSWVTANVLLCAIVAAGRGRWRRFGAKSWALWSVAVTASLATLLGAKTRNVWFAVMIAVGAWLLSQERKKFVLLTLSATAAFTLLLHISPDRMLEVARVTDRAADGSIPVDELVSGRLGILRRSIREILSDPGRVIIGTSRSRDEVEVSPGMFRSAGWHDPLWLIQDQGLPGFLFYYGTLMVVLGISFRAMKQGSREGRYWVYDLTFMLMLRIVISSLVDANLIIGHMDHIYFWLCAGCLMARGPTDGERRTGEVHTRT
jgi:hypothetical protein